MHHGPVFTSWLWMLMQFRKCQMAALTTMARVNWIGKLLFLLQGNTYDTKMLTIHLLVDGANVITGSVAGDKYWQ